MQPARYSSVNRMLRVTWSVALSLLRVQRTVGKLASIQHSSSVSAPCESTRRSAGPVCDLAVGATCGRPVSLRLGWMHPTFGVAVALA